MNRSTKCLFGGAIFAAGLVAPATAQNLSFQYSSAFVLAYDYPNQNQFSSDSFAGAGNFIIGAAVDGSAASIDHNPLFMSNAAISVVKGYIGGGVTAQSYFQVDQNTTLNISWDFSGDIEPGGNFIDSFLDIYDVTGGFGNIFHTDLNTPVGTAQLPVTAGNQYFLQGVTIALGGAGLSVYSVAVPTPGAAAILGVAGLVATRRRRS